MAIVEPGTDEERLMLGRWIKRGQKLIVGTSCLGDSYLDANVKRDEETQKQSEEYVAFDHKVSLLYGQKQHIPLTVSGSLRLF